MENNPYKAPDANLILENTEADDYMFYIVSPKKFLLMFIGTVGMYQLYWFYENWSRYKANNQLTLWPAPRALFSIFFTHSLFRLVNQQLTLKEDDSKWKHSSSATLVVALTLITNMDSIIDKAFGELISYAVILIIVPVTAWVLYGVQVKINQSCGSTNGEENSTITGANIFWLILGGLLWMLMIMGILLTINPDFFLFLGL